MATHSSCKKRAARGSPHSAGSSPERRLADRSRVAISGKAAGVAQSSGSVLFRRFPSALLRGRGGGRRQRGKPMKTTQVNSQNVQMAHRSVISAP